MPSLHACVSFPCRRAAGVAELSEIGAECSLTIHVVGKMLTVCGVLSVTPCRFARTENQERNSRVDIARAVAVARRYCAGPGNWKEAHMTELWKRSAQGAGRTHRERKSIVGRNRRRSSRPHRGCQPNGERDRARAGRQGVGRGDCRLRRSVSRSTVRCQSTCDCTPCCLSACKNSSLLSERAHELIVQWLDQVRQHRALAGLDEGFDGHAWRELTLPRRLSSVAVIETRTR